MQISNHFLNKCIEPFLNPFISIGKSVKLESKSDSLCTAAYHGCAARIKAVIATIGSIVIVPFLLLASGVGVIMGTIGFIAGIGCSQTLKKRAVEILQWTGKIISCAFVLGILSPLSILAPEFTINHLHAHEWKMHVVAKSDFETNLLCVLYDAGETAALVPVLKKWENEGKDFRVLVMATAETRIGPEMFPNKRLILGDLGANETIIPQTPRTTELNVETLQKIKALKPKVVLSGMASTAQQQILDTFSSAQTVAFADNFDYDPTNEPFKTVMKVHSVAKYILCPSQNVIETLVMADKGDGAFHHTYHVVGKPTVAEWERDILKVDRAKAIKDAGIEPTGKPIITFIGGYGAGYDIVDPLFEQSMEKLKKEGFRVIYQPHPRMAKSKIQTSEALAISDYVVGYNSSVIFDAALIGKNVLYMIPKEAPFDHFAIRQGLIATVNGYEGFLDYINSGRKCANIKQSLNMPQNSTETISNFIDELAR